MCYDSFTLQSVADLSWRKAHPWVQILSISCSLFGKFGKIVCWRPLPLGDLALPPRGNPGSTTASVTGKGLAQQSTISPWTDVNSIVEHIGPGLILCPRLVQCEYVIIPMFQWAWYHIKNFNLVLHLHRINWLISCVISINKTLYDLGLF